MDDLEQLRQSAGYLGLDADSRYTFLVGLITREAARLDAVVANLTNLLGHPDPKRWWNRSGQQLVEALKSVASRHPPEYQTSKIATDYERLFEERNDIIHSVLSISALQPDGSTMYVLGRTLPYKGTPQNPYTQLRRSDADLWALVSRIRSIAELVMSKFE